MLCSDLRNTLTLEEFESIRDLMEEQLKVIGKKIQKIQRNMKVPDPETESAAAVKLQPQHVHCLTCDRPLMMAPKEYVPH